MKRIEIFHTYEDHPWLGRIYGRLTPIELALVEVFVLENDELTKAEFEFRINRMFLDKKRPKHYKEIQELLSCCNSTLD